MVVNGMALALAKKGELNAADEAVKALEQSSYSDLSKLGVKLRKDVNARKKKENKFHAKSISPPEDKLA